MFAWAPPLHGALAQPIRVYVFAGQSNMVGPDTDATDLARIAPSTAVRTPRVLFWGPTADFPTSWAPLRAPTEVLQAKTRKGFGPEIGAAQMLARSHARSTIAIVKFAKRGTNLADDWNPSRSGGLYAQMIRRAQDAVAALKRTWAAPVVLAGFFWMQGESDSIHRAWADAYRANLTELVRAVRRDLHTPELPVVLGRIADLRLQLAPRFRYSDVVRRAQLDVARTVANTSLVSTDGLEHASTARIHFSSRGTYELGRRLVQPGYGL
jgi:hypothetical protein